MENQRHGDIGDNMKHQTISFIKSGVRIVGYLGISFLPFIPFSPLTALFLIGAVLVISELIGIVEEIGHE